MTFPILTFVVLSILGALSDSDHVLIGMRPSVEFVVRLNGEELSSSPLLADSLGIVAFHVEAEMGGIISLRWIDLDQPGLTCEESER